VPSSAAASYHERVADVVPLSPLDVPPLPVPDPEIPDPVVPEDDPLDEDDPLPEEEPEEEEYDPVALAMYSSMTSSSMYC